MVYKKIGSKIPSLSSLLLAGLLFAPGGCLCQDKHTSDNSNTLGRNGLDKEKLKDPIIPIDSTVDPQFFDAEKKLFDILLPSSSGAFFLTEEQLCQPIALENPAELGSRILSLRIRDSIKEINKRGIFPEDLKNSFKALENRKIWKNPKKLGLARLLNELFDYLNSFQAAVKELNGTAGDPARRLQVITTKFDPLLQKLQDSDSSLSLFNPEFHRGDVPASVLLSGERLARFLSDTHEDGRKRSTEANSDRPSNGTSEILARKEHVLVHYNPESPFKKNEKDNHDYLAQRGSSIGEPGSSSNENIDTAKCLKVKTSGYLPYIEEIKPIGTTPFFRLQKSTLSDLQLAGRDLKEAEKQLKKAREDFEKIKNGGKYKEEDTEYEKAQEAERTAFRLVSERENTLTQSLTRVVCSYDASPSTSVGAVVPYTVDSQLSFGTLLFTLFRGDGPFDFLSLSSKSKDGDCELVSNPDNFQNWSNKTEQQFLTQLHQHVQRTPELKDIFYTVDVKKIINKYFKASEYPTGPRAVGTSLNGPLSLVCDAIIETFPPGDQQSDFDKVTYIECIAALSRNSFPNSSLLLSFEDRFALSVAESIADNIGRIIPSSRETPPMTIDDFMNTLFIPLVENISEKSLLVIDEKGNFCPTKPFNLVYKGIKDLDTALANKLKKKSISHADIKSQVPDFDITKICKCITQIGEELHALFSFDFKNLLNQAEPISRADLIVKKDDKLKEEEEDEPFALEANETKIQSMNEIKEQYQASLAKLSEDKQNAFLESEENEEGLTE